MRCEKDLHTPFRCDMSQYWSTRYVYLVLFFKLLHWHFLSNLFWWGTNLHLILYVTCVPSPSHFQRSYTSELCATFRTRLVGKVARKSSWTPSSVHNKQNTDCWNCILASSRSASTFTWPLKGVCHEIFDLHFFHDSNPSRPLINRLKYFRIRFRRDIQP